MELCTLFASSYYTLDEMKNKTKPGSEFVEWVCTNKLVHTATQNAAQQIFSFVRVFQEINFYAPRTQMFL